jgi:hypothetical protein
MQLPRFQSLTPKDACGDGREDDGDVVPRLVLVEQ